MAKAKTGSTPRRAPRLNCSFETGRRLEGEPQLQLEVAVLLWNPADASALTRLGTDCRSRRESRHPCSEIVGTTDEELVRVVKDVERIPSEFHRIPFGKVELLVNAEVQVPSSRSAEEVSSGHI